MVGRTELQALLLTGWTFAQGRHLSEQVFPCPGTVFGLEVGFQPSIVCGRCQRPFKWKRTLPKVFWSKEGQSQVKSSI